jgi:N4-gp56 family major capsid protein
MPNDLTSGVQWSSDLPSWQRDYYSLLLLETLRTKSILTPFCAVKEDFTAANSGIVVYTEVYDTEPNWNPLTESSIWLKGAHMDSRTVQIGLAIYGDSLKFSDYSEVVRYVNSGNMRGLVKDKIGQNQVDMLDILARNAFATHPNPVYSGNATSRITLQVADDKFNPDILETIRVHLEENEIPGVMHTEGDDVPTLACVTTPRVIKDIRTSTSTSKWLEVQEYAGGQRKLNGEVGSWSGIRFVRSNRLRLRNHGAVVTQNLLNGAAAAGSGAKATVDGYNIGQSNAQRYIVVDSTAGFAVGQYVTISDQNAHLTGTPPLETDGTQETRRIVALSGGGTRIELDKPLLKDHADNDWVTNGIDIHMSIVMGGPSVVYAIGERPHPVFPPKYDDLMMINRFGWRGFLKFQQFRPEYYELVFSAGSTD